MVRQLSVFILSVLLSASAVAVSLTAGDAAPEFTLQGLSEKNNALRDLRAKGPVSLLG